MSRWRKLATGFIFTEGPVWHPYEKHLIFSDMPGDHMRKWTPRVGVTTFRKPCNKANGNVYDTKGRLVSCEHSTSRVIRTELDGSTTVLATHCQGKELNSPNDVIQAKDGSFIFTDPSYGRYGRVRTQARHRTQIPWRVPDPSRRTEWDTRSNSSRTISVSRTDFASPMTRRDFL
jgi:gluconolactonase